VLKVDDDTRNMPAKPREIRIPCSILARAAFVVTAIHFDDEAYFGTSEVNDVIGDNELTTEGKARLRAGELLPEEVFRAGGSLVQRR